MLDLSIRSIGLATAAVVNFIGVRIYHAVPLSAPHWVLVAVAALLCVAGFVSGGVNSAIESAPSWVVWSHRSAVWPAGLTVMLCTECIA